MLKVKNLILGLFFLATLVLLPCVLGAQHLAKTGSESVNPAFNADFLFPQITLNPDSFFVVIRPDTTQLRQMMIANTGDDTLFYSVNTLAKQTIQAKDEPRSIAGSFLAMAPQGYTPGETIDFSMSLYNGSPDNEWLDTLSIEFPAGVSVNFATNFIGGTQGPLVYDGSHGNGSTINWNDNNPGNGGNILPGETATSIANISFDQGLNDTLRIIYHISGDVHANEPHEITDTLLLIPEEVWLIATPDTGMVLPGEEQIVNLLFDSEGISIGTYFNHFSVSSNDTTQPLISVPVVFIVYPSSITQTINIPQGWSGISAYVDPFYPEFETIFDTVNDKIDVIKNFHSQLYWPDQGVNTIGDWISDEAYIINAKEAFQIKIPGLFQVSQSVILKEGWSILPVLNSVSTSTFVLFRDIEDKIDIVKEVDGDKVYWPEQSIYTLTTLIAGKAYYIRVKQDCFVVYPLPSK